MNRCQCLDSVIYSKDEMDAPITALPDSKNMAQGLRLRNQDISAKWKTFCATAIGRGPLKNKISAKYFATSHQN